LTLFKLIERKPLAIKMQREEKQIDMPQHARYQVGVSCKEMLIISKIKINEIGHKNAIDLAQCVGASPSSSLDWIRLDGMGIGWGLDWNGMDWNWNRRCLQTCAT